MCLVLSLRYILYSDCGCNQLCRDPWILRGSIDAGGRPKDIFDDDDVAKQDSNGIRTAIVRGSVGCVGMVGGM